LEKSAFVEYLTREIPPQPANMEAMVRENLGWGR
jgi:hydroxyacylglutathione hydrolase